MNWRRHQLQNVFGVVGGVNVFTLVEDMQHRDVDVLMLYPLDLVSVEERFGSWTTQYGYANMITQAKLLKMGKVKDGYIELAGRRFTTLATNFEPFPTGQLLDMMKELVETGGKVIWSGSPPIIDRQGNSILEKWQELFGVEYMLMTGGWGLSVPGHEIKFENALKNVEPQIVLTDFIVDHIFPVTPKENAEIVAKCGKYVVGTCRKNDKGGVLAYLGYRPRDDQSASLGYETRNWFEVLYAVGAYAGDGNTEVISRTTDYAACRFPNGTIAIAPHLTKLEEAWSGGFARNQEEDEAVTKQLDLPSKEIKLKSFKINGHCVDYEGIGAVAFRLNDAGELIAFAGQGCSSITINGKKFEFAENPVGQIGWAPITESRQIENGAKLIFFCTNVGNFRIPAIYKDMSFYTEGSLPGQKGQPVSCKRENEHFVIGITEASVHRWIFGIGK